MINMRLATLNKTKYSMDKGYYWVENLYNRIINE